MAISSIGIYWNTTKPGGLKPARELLEALNERAIAPMLSKELASALGCEHLSAPGELSDACDVIIVLGGDGTILSIAEQAARRGVPIVGVNVGHMGFMTELTPGNLRDGIDGLLAGEYRIESRMMLAAQINGAPPLNALNDIVICRPSGELKIVELVVKVGGAQLGRIMSDGIIVATPTGSTAYSLSAGGPVVDPLLDCMLVTPICPHSPLSRPAVLPDWETVDIMTPGGMDLQLSVDGRAPLKVAAGDAVKIRRCEFRAQFIRFGRHSFYEAFRRKLSEWSN